VIAYVDAQNGFGAMLRQNWYAVVKKIPDAWSVPYIRLGEQEYGDKSLSK